MHPCARQMAMTCTKQVERSENSKAQNARASFSRLLNKDKHSSGMPNSFDVMASSVCGSKLSGVLEHLGATPQFLKSCDSEMPAATTALLQSARVVQGDCSDRVPAGAGVKRSPGYGRSGGRFHFFPSLCCTCRGAVGGGCTAQGEEMYHLSKMPTD